VRTCFACIVINVWNFFSLKTVCFNSLASFIRQSLNVVDDYLCWATVSVYALLSNRDDMCAAVYFVRIINK